MPLIHQSLSTADVPARDRFEHWRELVMKPMFGLQAEGSAEQLVTLHASIAAWAAPCLAGFRYDSSQLLVRRGSREIAHRAFDAFLVYRERRPGIAFDVGGTEFSPATGEIVVWDLDEPFTTRAAICCTWEGWILPKTLLAPHLPARGRPLAMHLRGSTGPSGLLGAYLDALSRDTSALEGPSGDLIADHLGRLIAIACGAAMGPQKDAVASARHAQAIRHIELHLADPALSPGTVATALGISVRQLHLLFEAQPASFAGHVQRRRLQECRRVLDSPAGRTRSVADIAFGWGFGSLATFYRAFRNEFGTTPSELRGGGDEKPS